MEKEDVIAEVEGPSDWCAGIVPVPKEDNRVRMCGFD